MEQFETVGRSISGGLGRYRIEERGHLLASANRAGRRTVFNASIVPLPGQQTNQIDPFFGDISQQEPRLSSNAQRNEAD